MTAPVRELLGEVNGVQLWLAQTEQPWLVDAGALVVVVGGQPTHWTNRQQLPTFLQLAVDQAVEAGLVGGTDMLWRELPAAAPGRLNGLILVSAPSRQPFVNEVQQLLAVTRQVIKDAVLLAEQHRVTQLTLPIHDWDVSDGTGPQLVADLVLALQRMPNPNLQNLILCASDGMDIRNLRRSWKSVSGSSMPSSDLDSSTSLDGDPAEDLSRAAGVSGLSSSAISILTDTALLLTQQRPTSAASQLLFAALAHADAQSGLGRTFLRHIAIRTSESTAARLARTAKEMFPPEIQTKSVNWHALVGPGTDLGQRIELASRISAITGDSGMIHQRHLMAADVMLSEAKNGSLRGIGYLSQRVAAEALLAAITTLLPNENPVAWSSILQPPRAVDQPAEPFVGRPEQAAPAEAPRLEAELAGGVSADLVDPERGIPLAKDRLGVSTYVGMLATVISKADTPLPLSIGLFGEWGSGKSFFMGLLRQQITELSQAGEEYLTNIEQISFNAWHYADTNLWASLGNQIFEQLAGPGQSSSDRRESLQKDLGNKLERKRELTEASELARDETLRLRKDLEQTQAKKESSTQNLLRSLAESETLKDQFSKAWRRLGVQDQAEQGALLRTEADELATNLSVLRLATSGRTGKRLAIGAVLVLLLLALAALIPGTAGQWLARTGVFGLAGGLAALTAILARVRSGIGLLGKAVGEARAAARTSAEQGVIQQRAKLQEAEADEQLIQTQLDEVVARAGAIGRELADLAPGQRLYGFVSERAASEEYRRELGLVSTIRRDFQQLITLMADWRDNRGEDASRVPIDRIVLYIDDLDRCSPSQVVEVLQAVHLLLALDLFVVVVGVDPRWLLHSLAQQYRGNLVADAHPQLEEAAVTEWTAEPLDYLEKIFNIPLVLPRMTETSLEGLIRELVADAKPAGRPTRSPTAATDTETGHAEPPPVESVLPADLPVIEAGSELDAIRHGDKPEPRHLAECEIKLLGALGPLVESPRQGKRLLNLYRMLRSTRPLSVASSFVDEADGSGEFQAVGILLGLLVAKPRLLGELLWAPSVPDIDDSGGLCNQPAGATWAVLAGRLRPVAADASWQNCLGPLDETGYRDWLWVTDRLAAATAKVTLPDLVAFQAWGPVVARFSFVLSPLATAAASRA